MVEVLWDNESSQDHTILTVETGDRMGLLYDILLTIAEAQLNLAQASIDTTDNLAFDTFYLTDVDGNKITDPAGLSSIKELLTTAIKAKGVLSCYRANRWRSSNRHRF